MKRRILSLLLAMSLLATLLPLPSVAEEVAIEEAIESEEALPEEEAPVEEVPAEDAPEEPPMEEIPAEEIPEEEVPEEEPPVEEIPAEEPPVEEPPIAEEPEIAEEYEMDESLVSYALGSDGVQYAGVKYLSQAAYDSMPADSQAAYIEMVDELNGMLDKGVPVYDPVFYLKSDGSVGRTMGLPDFSGNGIANFDLPGEEPTEEPAAEEAPVPEPEPEEPEPEAEPEIKEGEPEAEVPEAEEAPAACIEENVELVESLLPERRADAPAIPKGNALDAAQFNTLFWDNKNFFYNQLTKGQKEIYDTSYYLFEYAYETGERFPATESSSLEKIEAEDILIAISALYDAYPAFFESLNWGGTSLQHTCEYDSYEKAWYWAINPVKSKYYSSSDEAAAQRQIEKLVSRAYDYARASYPSDFVYGVVSYFDDWLCENNVYKKSVMSETAPYSQAHYYCHTSYGALLKGYAVCDSYAKAMSRLLDAAGIPNLYAHGSAGANHAWNYVQMPDGKYYLLDSTENDAESENPEHKSTKKFLLKTNFTELISYSPGKMNWIDKKFDYPAISKSEYSPELNKTSPLSNLPVKANISLLKGESVDFAYYGDKKLNDYYRDLFGVSWYNSTSSVAAFQKNGKLKALKPGKTTLRMTFIDQVYTYDVYVCDVKGLYFRENGKATLDYTTNGLDMLEFPIDVQLGENTFTDEEIQGMLSDAGLSYGDFDKAEFTFDVEGNGYVLTVHPKKSGDVTCKLTLGKKTATLKLHIREEMDEDWFSLEYDETTYNGKAQKPKVIKEAGAPSDLKYSVKYSDNVNAGDGVVTITAKKGYGALKKYFTILPAPIEDEVKITDPKPQVYSGAPLSAAVTVKLGKKKLKAGTDYEIWYDYDEEVPVDAGTYSLHFEGKNYDGTLTDYEYHDFVIQPAPLTKVKMSLKKSSVKKDGLPVTAETLGLQVKIGKNAVPEEEYEISYRDKWGDEINPPTEPGSYTLVLTPVGDNIEATAKKRELTKGFKIK